jgi:hypothetical protein
LLLQKAIENALYANQSGDSSSRGQSFSRRPLDNSNGNNSLNSNNGANNRSRLGNNGSPNGTSFSEQSAYGGSFSSSSSFSSGSQVRRAEPAPGVGSSKSSSNITSPTYANGLGNNSHGNSINSTVTTDRNTFSSGSSSSTASTSSRSVVKGGSAGAFNPAALFTTRASIGPGVSSSSSSSGYGQNGDAYGSSGMEPGEEEDGVFVDRSHQERLIEQVC